MTVTTTTTRSTGTGDGVTLTFPFTFALQQAIDVQVYVDGVLQTLGADYSVTPAGGNYPCVGGNIVFTLPSTPSNGAVLLFIRVMDLLQAVVLPVDGFISEQTFENVFDKHTMQIQQEQEEIDRCIKIPVTLSGISVTLPNPVANTLLGWNATADALINSAVGTGTVVGPVASTNLSMPLWNGTTGTLLLDGPALGTLGQVLTSNGPGVAPSFQAAGGGGGFVLGPVSSSSNGIAFWNGASGTLLKDGSGLGTLGQVLTSNGAGLLPTFQAAGGGGGSVSGPVSSTNFSLVMWNGATGLVLRDGPALGTAGQIMTSNGAGLAPSFQSLTTPKWVVSIGGSLPLGPLSTGNNFGLFMIDTNASICNVSLALAAASGTTIRFYNTGSKNMVFTVFPGGNILKLGVAVATYTLIPKANVLELTQTAIGWLVTHT